MSSGSARRTAGCTNPISVGELSANIQDSLALFT